MDTRVLAHLLHEGEGSKELSAQASMLWLVCCNFVEELSFAVKIINISNKLDLCYYQC